MPMLSPVGGPRPMPMPSDDGPPKFICHFFWINCLLRALSAERKTVRLPIFPMDDPMGAVAIGAIGA